MVATSTATLKKRNQMKRALRRHRELILFVGIVFLTAAMMYGATQWWNATYIDSQGFN